jgi:aldose 1-epimerase
MSKVQTILLTNKQGTQLALTNVGATLMSLKVKDKKGNLINVVAGLKDAAAYASPAYQKSCVSLGATVGRYAGRISQGGFSLDGINYSLESDNGIHLHGGSEGFQNQLWEVVSVTQEPSASAVFRLVSPDGAQGYPGNLIVRASYELTNHNQLIIEYTATTDKKTVLNLTNHAYFNLNGTGTVANQLLQINANQILATNARLIPTGKFVDVKNTGFDYNIPTTVTNKDFNGLDTVFVLNTNGTNEPNVVLKSATSGIKMQVFTNQKAVVVFTPPKFDKVAVYPANEATFPAICFETQNFPDAPNQPNFPSAILTPGETYCNNTLYKFNVE